MIDFLHRIDSILSCNIKLSGASLKFSNNAINEIALMEIRKYATKYN